MKKLTRQDLSDILHGAAILGAGGGGDLDEGLDLIDQVLSAGKTCKLIDIADVPEDAIICTPYLLGAISPLPEEEEREYDQLSRVNTHPLLIAYDEFQKHLDQTFFGTTPCEMGGSNTAVAFFCAAMNDHYVIDADPAGRAVPEITHSTYYFAGLPASPIFAANEFGETFLLNNVADDQRAERIVRALSRVSRNDISVIDHALEMRILKDVLISGTISKAMKLGRVWRESIADATNIDQTSQRLASAGGGVVAFTGEVVSAEYKTIDGFTEGEIKLKGSGEYTNQSFRILVKNENLAAWLDDQVRVTIPDLICLFDWETGQPIINPHAYAGQKVQVVLLPAPVEFTSSKGLSVFGPSYAGIDAPYKPAVVNTH